MKVGNRKLELGTDPFDQQSVVGNYFVSAYPPFSQWKGEENGAYRGVLNTPLSSPKAVPLGMYCHIPFCLKRCDYCYYLSHEGANPFLIDEYLTALTREIEIYSQSDSVAERELGFLYIGGGTPSILSPDQTWKLIERIRTLFPFDHIEEITFECAPRTVTLERMRILKECGVNRISLGIQQLDDSTLKANGRIHRVADIERAYWMIRETNFETLNVDLMVGMVGERGSNFFGSLDRVIELDPDSITLYQLEIPKNTPLYHSLNNRSGAFPASWIEKHRRLELAYERLAESGYDLRSAYTAVRKGDKRPFVYQDSQYFGGDLIGTGVSAFSYYTGVHHQNRVSLSEYLSSLNEQKLPLGRSYVLSEEEQMIRESILQLKLGKLDFPYFEEKFGTDLRDRFSSQFETLTAGGWAVLDDNRVELTRSGLARVDEFLPQFYLEEHSGVRYS